MSRKTNGDVYLKPMFELLSLDDSTVCASSQEAAVGTEGFEEPVNFDW